MTTDLGTWGFIISLLCLVLMYPVGLFINISTPKVQDWWAKRSRLSLEKRIAFLKSTIQRKPDAQDLILFVAKRIFLILAALSHIVVVGNVIIFAAISVHNEIPHQPTHSVGTLRTVLLLLPLLLYFGIPFSFAYTSYRQLRRMFIFTDEMWEVHRQAMEVRIGDLEARLAKMK